MKEIIKRAGLLAAALTLILVLFSCSSGEKEFEHLEGENRNLLSMTKIKPEGEVRGIWVASVFNIDFPSAPDLSEEEMKNEIDAIIDICRNTSLNTVFFQVRSECDALYKSDIYPVSRFLYSDRTLKFDPLEYFVSAAHENGILLYAWVNPLRVTVSEKETLPKDSPASLHPEYAVDYAGKKCFDAGLPEVRDLVCSGIKEIAENYQVDGIVFDDYFYPYPANGEEFDDAPTFEKYGSDYDSIDDFRRASVTEMVREVYSTVKEVSKDLVFGISPFGIWQNNDGKNGGSDTAGFEGYSSLYCDAIEFAEEGIVDFLAPQLYWRESDFSSSFDTLCKWWNNALDGTECCLLISHAAYLYEEGNWESPSGEMNSQIEYARNFISYKGSVFYGLDEIKNNAFGIADEINALKDREIKSCIPSQNGIILTCDINSGDSLSEGNHALKFYSDPCRKVLYDGKKVTRNKKGQFTLDFNVESGKNTLVFDIDGNKIEFIIYGD